MSPPIACVARLFAESRYVVNNPTATEGCNIFALFRKRANFYPKLFVSLSARRCSTSL